MQWKCFAKEKPKNDCFAIVYNINRPFRKLVAIYNAYDEGFLEQNYSRTVDFFLAVTHYIEIPEEPKS